MPPAAGAYWRAISSLFFQSGGQPTTGVTSHEISDTLLPQPYGTFTR